LGLLYIEESGVPLPVPGDVYVAYLGQLSAGSMPALLASWLGIILVVVAGATNLYWISRRWGRRLLNNRRITAFLGLNEDRMGEAERWFHRWGVPAIIFGRHVPGLRVAITFMTGSLKVPYRTFAASVAVSTAIWAAAVLTFGALLGRSISQLVAANPWIYGLVGGALLVGLVYRMVSVRREMFGPA
jgi:membrane protein DedA with SNARE-associated domain